MTVFEKVTETPEALGTILSSLTVIDSPWEQEFHKVFCAGCDQENCAACPHEKKRNNPLWWLVQTTEGEQDTRRAVLVWRNGRLELGPGIIVPLQDEDRHADGTCNEFNVYLNGKGPDGKVLRNIKRVIMPTVSTYENGQIEPMGMKLVFGGCEDAAEIVALMGKKCKLEVRAAVENLSQGGQIEFHGLSYILEAVPLQIETDTVKRRGGLGLTISFLVYRYTAIAGDTELWSFEWGTQERQGDVHKTEKLFEEIKMKIIELDVPLEEAIKVLEIVKVACVNALKNKKTTQPQQEEGTAQCRATERQGGINPGRLRRSEILSLARLFHVSISTATEYHDILAAQAPEEFRLRRIRNALLIWSFVASAISIVLSLIRLAR